MESLELVRRQIDRVRIIELPDHLADTGVFRRAREFLVVQVRHVPAMNLSPGVDEFAKRAKHGVPPRDLLRKLPEDQCDSDDDEHPCEIAFWQ